MYARIPKSLFRRQADQADHWVGGMMIAIHIAEVAECSSAEPAGNAPSWQHA